MSKSNQIEEVLNSLQGSRSAAPGPFFTGRVLQRLNTSGQPNDTPASFRWVAAVAFVLVLIAMNLVVYLTHFTQTETAVNEWRSGTPAWVVDFTQNPVGSVYDVPSK